jgi:YD repeat-containing protein
MRGLSTIPTRGSGGTFTTKTDAGGTVALAYDAVNLNSSITDPTAARTTFAYDAANRMSTVAYPNAVTGTIIRDTAGQITSIEWKAEHRPFADGALRPASQSRET